MNIAMAYTSHLHDALYRNRACRYNKIHPVYTTYSGMQRKNTLISHDASYLYHTIPDYSSFMAPGSRTMDLKSRIRDMPVLVLDRGEAGQASY